MIIIPVSPDTTFAKVTLSELQMVGLDAVGAWSLEQSSPEATAFGEASVHFETFFAHPASSPDYDTSLSAGKLMMFSADLRLLLTLGLSYSRRGPASVVVGYSAVATVLRFFSGSYVFDLVVEKIKEHDIHVFLNTPNDRAVSEDWEAVAKGIRDFWPSTHLHEIEGHDGNYDFAIVDHIATKARML